MEAMEALVQFFKALTDPERLQVAGMLARRPASAEQLAAALEMKLPTVVRHLDYLEHAGLAARLPDRPGLYRWRLDHVHALAARVSPQAPPPVLDDDLDAFDQKVLRDFLRPDGSLKEIPMQPKKTLAVLRHIIQRFEVGRLYTEKQVNEVLARFHGDSASLRRYLVDYQFMRRSATGSQYWRTLEADEATKAEE